VAPSRQADGEDASHAAAVGLGRQQTLHCFHGLIIVPLLLLLPLRYGVVDVIAAKALNSIGIVNV
jgi:hypothetical protein